jgi:putative transposase
VWVTKYRKSVFVTDALVADMKQILYTIAKRNDVEITHLEVLPEHVHMMLSFAPKQTPSSIVKAFKGGSAKQWFAQHPETKKSLWGGHLWSPSFFMSTLGDVSKDIVAKYIDSQVINYNGGRPRH